MNCLNRRYKKNPDIVFRKIANEYILVPIRQNVGDIESIYALNEAGARIWELIDGEKRVSEIKEIITKEFDVAHEQAEADMFKFLNQLETVGGIKV